MLRKTLLSVLVLAMTLMPFEAPAGAVATTSGKTLDNLQAAYNGESNAAARYLAFAKKADADGLAPVASLFRAAARAEEIHASNHAKVIRELGGVPKAQVEDPKVGPTKENLDAAIKGESYERDTMYPDFIKAARSEGQKGALESFNYAKSAEAEHARLYTVALENIDTVTGKPAVTYYVCTVCGFTTTKLDFTKCPACFSPKDKYILVG
jgi:rubrerythrin